VSLSNSFPMCTLLNCPWSSRVLTLWSMYYLLITIESRQSIPVSIMICNNLVQFTWSNAFCQTMKQAQNSSMSKFLSDISLHPNCIPSSFSLFKIQSDIFQECPKLFFFPVLLLNIVTTTLVYVGWYWLSVLRSLHFAAPCSPLKGNVVTSEILGPLSSLICGVVNKFAEWIFRARTVCSYHTSRKRYHVLVCWESAFCAHRMWCKSSFYQEMQRSLCNYRDGRFPWTTHLHQILFQVRETVTECYEIFRHLLVNKLWLIPKHFSGFLGLRQAELRLMMTNTLV